jgi:UDP:flavonoid glycosyltransferase YjiC (YdhE family)
MKVLLLSIGTRGDMEPFLALGDILQKRGEQVTCAFPEQFRELADESGLDFISLGPEFVQMLDSDDGKAAMGGSGSGMKKFMAHFRLARKQTPVNRVLVEKQQTLLDLLQPDMVVYNGKAILPVIREMDHPGRNILLSPVPHIHYVKGHAHVAFNCNLGPFLNKLTYRLADAGMLVTIRWSLKWLNISQKYSRKQIRHALSSRKVVYTISPVLFTGSPDWPPWIRVLGHHRREKNGSWEPDRELTLFMERHPKFLFITFGSMLNGLVEPGRYNRDLVHFVSQVPYDRMFGKAYGVVHHGGSGTTHMALRHGCPTLIIPHIIDQHVWNSLVHDLGAGPRGVKIGRLSNRLLEPKILDLWENESYRQRAEQLAGQLKEEKLADELYFFITGYPEAQL